MINVGRIASTRLGGLYKGVSLNTLTPNVFKKLILLLDSFYKNSTGRSIIYEDYNVQ